MSFISVNLPTLSLSKRLNQSVLASVIMYQRVQNLFQWRADLLMANRLSDLAEQHMFPWTVYLENTPITVPTADSFAVSIGNFRDHMIARGTCRLVARLTALDVPRNGRFRAWISQFEMGPDENVVKSTRIIQYCRETEAGIRTEMTQCWNCAIEDFSPISIRNLA